MFDQCFTNVFNVCSGPNNLSAGKLKAVGSPGGRIQPTPLIIGIVVIIVMILIMIIVMIMRVVREIIKP